MSEQNKTARLRQAHGLSQEEMLDLQVEQQQAENSTVKEIKKKVKVAYAQGESRTAEYSFPAHEKHLVHVELEIPGFDPATGARTSIPWTQKFYPNEYKAMEKTNAFAGHKVTILHDPSNEVEGVEPEDSFEPKIVSNPGAGISLIERLDKKKVAELQGIYKEFRPNEVPPADKKALVEEIEKHITFMNDEKLTDELRATYENRLKALDLL